MGAYTEIVDFTFTANETSRTFSGLSITKDDFIKVVSTIVNVGSTANIALFPNNETTATNYHVQLLGGFSSSTAAARNNTSTINSVSGSNSATGIAYAKLSQNDRFNIFLTRQTQNDSGLNMFFDYTTSSGVTFPSGITSLTFTSSVTNGLGTGSRIQIYKLAAEKVADITVTSNTTQVDISNLSIDKDSEYLLVSDVVAVSSNANINITPNDLTTVTGYFSQRIIGSGSSPSATRQNTPRYFAALTNTRTVGYNHIKLSNIGAFTYQSYHMLNVGLSTPLIINEFGSSTAENITSINKLNIISAASNSIGTGSRFTLYKLYE